MIKVLFFAELRERLGVSELLLKGFIGSSVADVLQEMARLNPHWHSIITEQKVLVAVNHTLSNCSAAIASGDEVAFFPPVTGG